MTAVDGRAVIVTGAASGIGAATARRLHGGGAHVYGLDIDTVGLKEVADDLVDFTPVTIDLGDGDALDELPDRLPVDDITVLCNIAGALDPGPLHTYDMHRFRRTVEVMLCAPAHLARLVLPGMRCRGAGVIVNMGSVYGLLGGDGKGGYVAAKHGLHGLTRQLALEGAMCGVRAFTVCPGHVDSPLLVAQADREAELDGVTPAVRLARLRAQLPTGRFVTADEVADVVAWLAGDAPRSMTGVAVPIDGGWTAGTVSGVAG